MNDNMMIPIMVKQGDKEKVWYMDISSLGLSELLSLRESLKGTTSNSIPAIDSVINTNYLSDYAYNKLENTYKRTDRRKSAKKRDLSHKYHRR